jgi:hypothetical protein
VNAPGSSDPAVNAQALNSWVNAAKALIPADKDIMLVAQAYSRNYQWTDINSLTALQNTIYLQAYNDPRVFAIGMFSLGRGSGSAEYPSMILAQKQIGNAILNKNCP